MREQRAREDNVKRFLQVDEEKRGDDTL